MGGRTAGGYHLAFGGEAHGGDAATVAFEDHFLAVGEVPSFLRWFNVGCYWGGRCFWRGEHGNLAGGVGGGMSGGGWAEGPGPIVAIEGVDGVIELVGRV